jgi:hypothetical protein
MKSIALLIGIFTATSALAYIPPPQFILDRVLKSREGLKSLELVADVVDVQRNVRFRETLRLDFVGGRFWTVTTDDAGTLSSSKFGKLTELQGMGQAWIEIGIDPSQYRFREALQQHDVWPTDKTEPKLVRDGTKISWAWGESDHEIRIQKDHFVWAGYTDNKKNELQVKDQARFPRVIAIKERGQDKFQYTLRGFKINAPVKWNTTNLVPPQGPLVDSIKDWVDLVR